ncbi:MAG: hypothetical protein COB62_02215 [Piscirickettsiaceae bacterium]|nr:MAG: hypothetical protein COB62_02215 [Piscirickettsiaceae bacterium]
MHYALCPNCSSTLQISQQQIEAKNGLVRCGHCKDIFDAKKHQLTPSETTQALKLVKEEPPISVAQPQVTQEKQEPITTESDDNIEAVWENKQEKTTSRVPYSLLALILLSIFIYQAFYFNVFSITQNTALQPAFEMINKSFGLNIPRYKNLDDIRVIDRQLSTHPILKNTLQLKLTVKNTAATNQDYPIINIKLTSAAGKQVAQATFHSKDYLPSADIYDPFGPLSSREFIINFNSPKETVTGFEIYFSY